MKWSAKHQEFSNNMGLFNLNKEYVRVGGLVFWTKFSIVKKETILRGVIGGF